MSSIDSKKLASIAAQAMSKSAFTGSAPMQFGMPMGYGAPWGSFGSSGGNQLDDHLRKLDERWNMYGDTTARDQAAAIRHRMGGGSGMPGQPGSTGPNDVQAAAARYRLMKSKLERLQEEREAKIKQVKADRAKAEANYGISADATPEERATRERMQAIELHKKQLADQIRQHDLENAEENESNVGFNPLTDVMSLGAAPLVRYGLQSRRKDEIARQRAALQRQWESHYGANGSMEAEWQALHQKRLQHLANRNSTVGDPEELQRSYAEKEKRIKDQLANHMSQWEGFDQVEQASNDLNDLRKNYDITDPSFQQAQQPLIAAANAAAANLRRRQDQAVQGAGMPNSAITPPPVQNYQPAAAAPTAPPAAPPAPATPAPAAGAAPQPAATHTALAGPSFAPPPSSFGQQKLSAARLPTFSEASPYLASAGIGAGSGALSRVGAGLVMGDNDPGSLAEKALRGVMTDSTAAVGGRAFSNPKNRLAGLAAGGAVGGGLSGAVLGSNDRDTPAEIARQALIGGTTNSVLGAATDPSIRSKIVGRFKQVMPVKKPVMETKKLTTTEVKPAVPSKPAEPSPTAPAKAAPEPKRVPPAEAKPTASTKPGTRSTTMRSLQMGAMRAGVAKPTRTIVNDRGSSPKAKSTSSPSTKPKEKSEDKVEKSAQVTLVLGQSKLASVAALAALGTAAAAGSGAARKPTVTVVKESPQDSPEALEKAERVMAQLNAIRKARKKTAAVDPAMLKSILARAGAGAGTSILANSLIGDSSLAGLASGALTGSLIGGGSAGGQHLANRHAAKSKSLMTKDMLGNGSVNGAIAGGALGGGIAGGVLGGDEGRLNEIARKALVGGALGGTTQAVNGVVSRAAGAARTARANSGPELIYGNGN